MVSLLFVTGLNSTHKSKISNFKQTATAYFEESKERNAKGAGYKKSVYVWKTYKLNNFIS